MFEKKITLIIGNDIHQKNEELFDDFESYEYQGFYFDEFGLKQTMDYWNGDKFFNNYLEIFYFFGIDEDEDCSRCQGLRIWFNEYSKFNEKDKEIWMQLAKDSGHPTQIKINTNFGEIKDFEYKEIKNFR